MKYISIILCLITFSFTEDFSYDSFDDEQPSDNRNGFFERFYIYGSFYNYQSVRDTSRNLKENSAGVNLVKTIELPFGDRHKLRVDGKAIFDNYATGSEEIFTFNELYFIAKFNGIEFEVGRKYVDFSIAKTYSLLDFISTPLTVMDSEDDEISKQGKDGVAFGYTPSWLKDSKMFFYAYTDEFSDIRNKSEELLVELRIKNQFAKARAYSFFNDQSESSLAGSIIANVNRDTDVYSELKYTNGEYLDYILGVNYQAYKNFSVRVERVILNSSINNKEFVDFDGNKTQLGDYYNNKLSGRNYINMFLKYSFPEYPSSVYFSVIRNMGDRSTRISTKVDYLQGKIKYYGQLIRSLGGDEHSELSYKAHTKITFHISLGLTDKKIEPLRMQ